MCGISGAVGWIDTDIESALTRVNGAQRHRGPDDEGTWKTVDTSGGRGAAFAFRRLAIIDLSPDGHQPMVDRETGNVIVFNGELYNYKLLRSELAADGATFKSQSDTEVLLKGYAKWGMQVLPRLRGMFALAIWDERRRQVVLARDRLGIKPLYLCTRNTPGGRKTVFFASEVRSLLAADLAGRRLNPRAVATYVWNGFVVGPETIVEGVELLAAGSTAVVRLDGLYETHSYWKFPRHAPAPDGEERVSEALETSVRQHLVSDVPLGVFLSGGIDSSAVTALAAKTAGSGVRTFNLCFDEAQYDESRYATAVARALGTDHTEVRLSKSDFKSELGPALASIDQPTFDAINSYFVSRAVRDAGMTVALAGTGGDELFGGYSSFVDIPRARRAARALRILPRAVVGGLSQLASARMRGTAGAVAPQTRWGKLGDVLGTRGDLVGLYQTTYALFTADFAREILGARRAELEAYGLPPERAHALRRDVAGDEIFHSICVLELANFIGERLLRDTDAASMAVSLEVRVPLLDHEVVEAVATVETERRFFPLGRKQLLRKLALSSLPPEQFDRPKQGFGLPMAEWCRDVLRDEMDAAFADPAACSAVGLAHKAVSRLWTAFQAGAPGIYWSRLWSIFVLIRWCQAHRVSR